MNWNKETEEKLKLLLAKLPLFHRHIAEEVVRKKAGELASQRGSEEIGKEDLACAFLSEVPEVFRNYLDDLLKEVGLNNRNSRRPK
ncbi:MAG: hypothetical protein V1662_04485 [Candidatus Omnitrophota bacterium]